MWLLDAEVYERMRLAMAMDPSQLEASPANITALAQVQAQEGSGISNGVAQIKLSGVMTDKSDIFARIFGGGNSTYLEFTRAVRNADADPRVSSIDLLIDSPGGMASARWQAAMTAVAETQKPVRAIITRALSAAYGIAAQADEIIAVNDMAPVGSVGVAVSAPVDENKVTITSTNAPKKRPNPQTVEGQSLIREQLDAVEALFIQMIASGRGIDEASVRQNFGQGASLLARDGLNRNMIDSIGGVMAEHTIGNDNGDGQDDDNGDNDKDDKYSHASSDTKLKPLATVAGQNEGVESMDLATLRNSHPAVFAEAVQMGVDQERERVSAHLTLGDAFGAMDIAASAIKDGKPCGHLQQAEYMAKGASNGKITARAEGDDALAAAANGAGGTDAAGVTGGNSFEGQIMTSLESLMGMEAGA